MLMVTYSFRFNCGLWGWAVLQRLAVWWCLTPGRGRGDARWLGLTAVSATAQCCHNNTCSSSSANLHATLASTHTTTTTHATCHCATVAGTTGLHFDKKPIFSTPTAHVNVIINEMLRSCFAAKTGCSETTSWCNSITTTNGGGSTNLPCHFADTTATSSSEQTTSQPAVTNAPW